MLEKKFHFVYITTNLINNKQYIGDHSTHDLQCAKTKSYLGSGWPYLQNAIKKYKKENFKRKILEYFDTKQEAFNAQEKYIKKYNTLAPNGYNLSPMGGYGVRNSYLSKDTKKKLSQWQKGKKRKPLSEETKKKISNGNKNKIISEETKYKMSLAAKGKSKKPEHAKKCGIANLGKKHSLQTKEKISLSMKGKNIGSKSEETKKKISESRKGKPAWNKGIPCSEESKRKQIETKKNKEYIN